MAKVATLNGALEHRRRKTPCGDIAVMAGKGPPGRFIGQSAAMQVVYRILRNAAPTNATVFITGESGVGKGLCAEALHKLSKRKDGPFVAVNCAAIPKDLMESEIFGHVKGAFTGASSDRKGAALQADRGTLFLDEIAEMDLALQTKLLRFLQERTVQRLGEDTPRRADIRVVCATNRDPLSEVLAGRFREDLFYRLHVVPVELPPLRERDRDIVLLARHFLDVYADEDDKAFKAFSPEAEAALLDYGWPGNVRQLQNVIRSAVVLNHGDVVTLDMLPRRISGLNTPPPPTTTPPIERLEPVDPAPPVAGLRPLEDVIRSTIEEAISACDGSISRAAAALAVAPSTLYRRIHGWRTETASQAGNHAIVEADDKAWAAAGDATAASALAFPGCAPRGAEVLFADPRDCRAADAATAAGVAGALRTSKDDAREGGRRRYGHLAPTAVLRDA